MKEKIVKCENGWKSIYQPIIEAIYKHDAHKQDVDEKIGIEEVCEKYGMIAIKPINPFNLTDEISMMITNAGRDSLSVCEYCGSREHIGVTMNFKYKTCCKHCWKEKILKNEPTSVWKEKL